MRQRLISAAALVPVVVIVFVAGHPWLAFGITALSAVAGFETAQLVRRAGLQANTALAVVAPPLAVVGFLYAAVPSGNWAFQTDAWLFIAPAMALWVMATVVVSLRNADQRSAFLGWVGTLFAGLYPSLLAFAAGIGVLGYIIVPSDNLSEMFGGGRLWLIVLVLTVWSLDSAAYVVGRYMPRGRFMNHISPKKTWSGAVGGTVAAVAVCTLLASVVLSVSPIIGALTGLLIAVAAQAGDLAESMLKRAAGAKDSGTLIPGHGGILDRVDSFLFAAPVTYAWLLVLMLNGQAVW